MPNSMHIFTFPTRERVSGHCLLRSFIEWTTLMISIGILQPLFLKGAETSSPYHVMNWQVEHGLPQNTIRLITQTSDGYLWIATDKEVIRFDGLVFRTLNKRATLGFDADVIHCIYGDQQGGLWIGSGQHLFRYQPGRFTHYKTEDGLAIGTVGSVREDQSGAVYVAAVNGLYQVKGDQLLSIKTDDPDEPKGGQALAVDSDNRLWVAWGNTLFYRENGIWQKESQLPVIINTINVEEDGTIWCGLNAGFIAWLKPGKEPTIEFAGPGSIFETAKDRNGDILYRVSDLLHHFPSGSPVPLLLQDGEPIQHIQSIFQDRDKNIWLGTKGKGLALLRPQPLTSCSTEEGLPHSDVKTIEEFDSEGIWVGTMGGGVAQFRDNQFHPIPLNGYPYIGPIRKTSDGQLWVGMYGNHLWKLNQGLPKLETRSRALTGRCLFEDTQGGLWIGGEGMGAERLFHDKVLRLDKNNGLSSNNVSCFAQAPTGAIWIGTDKGLHQYAEGQVNRFGEDENLADIRIQSLFVDSVGALWIGTEAPGFIRFHQDTFQTKSTEQGIFNDSIAQIIEDDFGYLWLGTNRRLFRTQLSAIHDFFDGKTKRLGGKSFGKAEGMQSQQCSAGFQPNCLKASDGTLWFTTADGVVRANPATIEPTAIPPQIHIDRFLADGTPISRSDMMTPDATTPLPEIGIYSSQVDPESVGQGKETTFDVPAGTSRIEFHYTGISFTAPEGVQYRYRLNSYDADWTVAGSQSVAAYTRVPPGQYSFEVQAGNSEGTWNPSSAILSFEVQPLLIQTWWFKGGSAFVVCLTIFALSYGPILRRRQLAQLRLQISRDLHDEVGSNLGSISLYSQLAEAKSGKKGDISSEFGEINRTIQQTAQSLRDVIWFTNPKFDTLDGMLQQMEDTANRMLAAKQFTFKTDCVSTDRRLSLKFRREIFLIYREILHNILKHSQAERVEINIVIHHNHLYLTIIDSGVGFSTDKNPGGNGLNNMKHRTEELRGKMHIQSKPGEGTTFQIEVPVT